MGGDVYIKVVAKLEAVSIHFIQVLPTTRLCYQPVFPSKGQIPYAEPPLPSSASFCLTEIGPSSILKEY